VRRLVALVMAVSGSIASGTRGARADPPAGDAGADAGDADRARRADATWSEIIAGPFPSSRLFAMPIADVVGPYRLAISEDGSLLQETGVLSSAGVIALGFGDLAQLEYRHTSAISITHTTAPVPAVGVQLKLPLPVGEHVPAVALAFRLGVPRREQFGGTSVDETVTDLYLVSRLRLLAALTLHAGVRVSSAEIAIGGAARFDEKRVMVLPAGGAEIAMNTRTRLVGEIGLAPSFRYTVDGADGPTIGSGVLARLGVRWQLVPALTIDGSVGYQLEVAGAHAADGVNAVVQWDIRLGAELVVPWGAIACRTTGIFCR
jgi:hypothetical protein